MLSKMFKICICPTERHFSIFQDIVIHLAPPYDDDFITIDFNMSLEDYESMGSLNSSSIFRSMSVDTGESFRLTLNLSESPESNFSCHGKNYKIRLVSMHKKEINGQRCPEYTFYIEEFELTSFQNLGTAKGTFCFPDEHYEHWTSDNKFHKIAPIILTKNIIMRVHKNTDNILEIFLNGPLGYCFTPKIDISTITAKKLDDGYLHIAWGLTWEKSIVKIYINGDEIIEEFEIT